MRTERNTEIPETARVLRRHRTKQERREIAEESLQPNTSVAVVARRHSVNANQVFHWRKLLREGGLDLKPSPAQLMPVRVIETVSEEPGPVRTCSGTIHIELGRTRIRVEGCADTEALRMILEQLGR